MNLAEFFRLAMDREILDGPYAGYGMRKINLGHGAKQMPAGVESIGLPEWNAENMPLPYADGSVDEIWALHFLEHIQNIVPLLAECQRILRQGGVMNICVPYGAGHLACQDITHQHMFNEETWKTLFSNPYYDPSLGAVDNWRFGVALNVIMGVKGTNLALLTQLVRTG